MFSDSKHCGEGLRLKSMTHMLTTQTNSANDSWSNHALGSYADNAEGAWCPVPCTQSFCAIRGLSRNSFRLLYVRGSQMRRCNGSKRYALGAVSCVVASELARSSQLRSRQTDKRCMDVIRQIMMTPDKAIPNSIARRATYVGHRSVCFRHGQLINDGVGHYGNFNSAARFRINLDNPRAAHYSGCRSFPSVVCSGSDTNIPKFESPRERSNDR